MLRLPAMLGLIAYFACCFSGAHAFGDWPQFRGTNAAGVASESNPPIHFGPAHNQLWKLPLDSGHSSPVINGDAIFLTSFDESEQRLSVLAVDRIRGQVRWQHWLETDEIEKGHPSFNAASSTPATDGQRVVAYFGSYGLLCLDRNGTPLWEIRMPLTKSYAGNAISPIICGDKVILYRANFVDHFLLAVDKTTGQELWRVDQTEPFDAELACSAVPIVKDNVLILHGARSVQAFDLNTGEQLWVTKCGTTATSSPILAGGRVLVAAWNKMGEPALRPDFPEYASLLTNHDQNGNNTIEKSEFPRMWIFHRPEGAEAPQNGAPLQFGRVDQNKDGHLSEEEWRKQLANIEQFRQGYQNHGLLSLPIDGRGILDKSEIRTLETQGIPEVPSPISDGRYVYLAKNGGQITCIEISSGERVYRIRTGGRGTHYASPIIAGEQMYIADVTGRIAVVSLGPNPEVLAVNEMDEGVFATPAVTGDTLYVRTRDALYAFAHAK